MLKLPPKNSTVLGTLISKTMAPCHDGGKTKLLLPSPSLHPQYHPETLTTDANFITEELTLGQIEF